LPGREGSLKWRRILLFVAAWTLIALVFATVSYAASLSEGNRGFGFISALEFNLVLFYLWAVLSLLIFWFSRRFPVEMRPVKTGNLLLHIPAVITLRLASSAREFRGSCSRGIRFGRGCLVAAFSIKF
jgi:hypothetical protein